MKQMSQIKSFIGFVLLVMFLGVLAEPFKGQMTLWLLKRQLSIVGLTSYSEVSRGVTSLKVGTIRALQLAK